MINREAVMHTPRSSDCYPFAERGLCIRLRTAKGNVEKVQVLIAVFTVGNSGKPSIWIRWPRISCLITMNTGMTAGLISPGVLL